MASATTTLPGGTDAQAFCYDEENRLVWASSQSGSVHCGGTLSGAGYTTRYAYDTLDRLTSGPLGAYSYGNSAHLHAVTATGSAYTARYDPAGNMTCRAPSSSACTRPGGQVPRRWTTAPRRIMMRAGERRPMLTVSFAGIWQAADIRDYP